MDVSKKLKYKIKRVLLIVIAWMGVGVLITIYDHFTLISGFSEGPSATYTFRFSLMFSTIAGFMGGIMGGSFLVFYVNEKYRDKPYGFSILAVSIVFVVIVTIITVLLGSLSVYLKLGQLPWQSVAAQESFSNHMINPLHVKNILIWSIVVILTQITLQVNDKFGQGLLWDFILGKYHTPRQELRVFMFLDLKDSTTIAEKLGNQNYYRLLRDFYSDITSPIIYNGGQIYQYVGDEVVISWPYDIGIASQNCVKCYFDILEKIEERKQKYLEKYNIIPQFKAGLHFGEVTAGEIGIIKRDITYSGDVLNTAARLQGRCNEYGALVLVSGQLKSVLEKITAHFMFKKVGEEVLKGKFEKIEIYSAMQTL